MLFSDVLGSLSAPWDPASPLLVSDSDAVLSGVWYHTRGQYLSKSDITQGVYRCSKSPESKREAAPVTGLSLNMRRKV